MERSDRRPAANRVAVAGEVQAEPALALRAGCVDVHEPDRLLGSAAPRPGDAGHGDGDIGAKALARTVGHGRRRLGRHGSEALEGLLGNCQLRRLDLVRVGDDRAEEDVAGARYGREP
jgi:hypothetical protein